ncbi:MAG: TonB-dependent receptor [Verrucomicrobiota bacterium JB022]|nr:TonB-dependent receptor [Verrucomicrobiota bacterium JB022]
MSWAYRYSFPLFGPLAVSLAAQAPLADRVYELEAVEVTSPTGLAQNVNAVPQSIDAVGPQSASLMSPTWVGEMLNTLPGVLFVQLRGPIDAPSVRLPVSYENTQMYLQDGVPLQSPISYNHAAFAYSGALTSLGGVEVLKGPGTALHGSDAFGAVINVKSLAPTGTPSGSFRLAGGSYGLFEARTEVSDGLGGGHSYRVALSTAQEDGWRDMTGWWRHQAIVRHRWANDRTQVDTFITATDFDSEMAGTHTPESYAENPRGDAFDPAVPRDKAHETAKYLRLHSEVTHRLDNIFTLQVTPYLRWIDSDYMVTWEPATLPEVSDDTETLGLLARLYADWSPRSQTVLGFDVEQTDFATSTLQTLPTVEVWGDVYPQGLHYDYEVDYRNLAPYLQHTQDLGNNVKLLLGLRYENARYVYDNHLASGQQDAFYRPADRTDRFEAVNPKAGLNWEFLPDRHLYARYAHGFRIPKAESLYALNSSQTGFSLDPEQIDSYELGFKGALTERVYFATSVYTMRSRDGLTGVTTLAGEITTNAGKRRYDGVEAQIAWRARDNLTLTLAGAVQGSEILQDQPDGEDPRGVNGKTPHYQPARSGHVGLQWWPEVLERRLMVGLGLQYLGPWWIDDQNTARTDDEYLVDLRLRYAFASGWAVTGKVLNLLDREFPIAAHDSGYGPRFRPVDAQRASVGLERAW